jgi:ATP-dependent RNA helicase DeaD
MDQIVKADVDEEQIAHFMQDINRYFEYVDKDDLIKKIVSLEFGKFLAYYADAPEILPVSSRKGEGRKDAKSSKGGKSGQKSQPSEGYRKLFINLGKKDGFYPGELMQFLNKNVHGHVAVGHIDLLQTMSYFEVPEEDAERVIKYVNGQQYKRREVRCNDATEGRKPAQSGKTGKPRKAGKPGKSDQPGQPGKPTPKHSYKKEDWMQFLNPNGIKLKGEIPDFSEEGWAIRKPRKKK